MKKVRNQFLIILFLLINLNYIQCAIWQVGPGRTYIKPSQVAGLIQNGDTVEIDAGIYSSDVAHWTADDILLKGVNGFAQLFSNGMTQGDKAIWVIGGNNTRVENIEFAEATSTANNGAGIRQEGHNLIISHCFFHDNEDGILAGTVNPSNITIEFSEFSRNGYGDGFTHNIYINNIDTLIFRYNYSHHAIVGHELKSRAHVNFILYNRISDEDSGSASRSIDLPNGGTSYIIGNVIEQGPLTQNSNIIGFGLEGLNNPSPHKLYAINNTIINNYPGGSFFHCQTGIDSLKAFNNILAGGGNFFTGTIPAAMDTLSNIQNSNISSFNFLDAFHYDYHLTSLSASVINSGSSPGIANGFILTPLFEYQYPNSFVTRCISGTIDIGAFEYCSPLEISEPSIYPFTIASDPANHVIRIYSSLLESETIQMDVYNSTGSIFKKISVTKLPAEVSTLEFPPGIYFVKISHGSLNTVKKLMVY